MLHLIGALCACFEFFRLLEHWFDCFVLLVPSCVSFLLARVSLQAQRDLESNRGFSLFFGSTPRNQAPALVNVTQATPVVAGRVVKH